MSDVLARELRREVTVGIFAFAVLLGLFAFSIFVTGGVLWNRGRYVEIKFDDVMGLRNGDNVVMHGMTVGQVKKVVLDKPTGRIVVVCRLSERVSLKTDASAEVASTSILGGRQLVLIEGSYDAAELPDGAPIEGRNAADIMSAMGDIARDLRSMLREGGLSDLKTTLKDVREIADKINRGDGTLGMLVNDRSLYCEVASAVTNIRTITAQIKDGNGTIGKLVNDSTLYDDVSATVTNIKAITAMIRDGNGTLGKLVNESAMYDDMRTTIANVKEVSQRVADGKGVLGKLMSEDETIYNDAKTLLEDARAAVQDYRESSPILTFTTILFGVF